MGGRRFFGEFLSLEASVAQDLPCTMYRCVRFAIERIVQGSGVLDLECFLRSLEHEADACKTFFWP